jgi:trigger factor
MKLEIEEISAVERKLVVEVPAERVSSEFARAYDEVSRHASVKGFRKGKVPRPVLERHYGEDVLGQVTQSLIQEGFSFAMEESKLEIVAEPKLDFEPPVEGEALSFSATVEIRPELGDVSVEGLVVQRPSSTVADEEVEKVLEQIRERHSQLVPVEDRTDLARGDYATISIEASVDGEKVDALCVEAGTVEVAGGNLPEALDEKLEHSKVGDTFTLETSAPEGAPEDLKEKNVSYAVDVKSVSEKKAPELDDEFAKDHGDCDSLEAMRTQIRERLEGEAVRKSDAAVNEAILDVVLERTEFIAPGGMVDGRVDALLREFSMELAQQGMRLNAGEHEDEAREKLRPRAEREVRANILLEHLAEQLSISVDEEALAAEVSKIVESAGEQADRAREYFADPTNSESLRGQLQRSQTLEKLVAGAEITEATS